MNTKAWMYAQNPFLTVTQKSFLNALNLSTYHEKALKNGQTDPAISALYTTYHPIHDKYETAYNKWKAQGGVQQGDTLNESQLLELLRSTKIQQWDTQVQIKYPQNTPQYKKLFPNRRKPFQNGKQAEITEALHALMTNISTDTALSATYEDIDDFYTQLYNAGGQQKSNQSSLKKISSELEIARVAMCDAQFADLGALIQKFSSTPKRIEDFFDLALLRRKPQSVFQGQLKPSEIMTIVKHTFVETNELKLFNNGASQLKFYLAHGKNAQPGTTAVVLDKGDLTVLASALGLLTDLYLTVQNTNALVSGEFKVELL
jgi:hypothetical protein